MLRKLILEDGSEYIGTAFGGSEFVVGELVFTTGTCGYQETISDPTLCGQLVVLSYPLIGNAGMNKDDNESMRPSLFGLIVKEVCDTPSNGSMTETLDEYLDLYNIPGIQGIDTRAIVKKIRDCGTMKARFANMEESTEEVVKELKNTKLSKDQVSKVSCSTSYSVPNYGHRVVLVDFGVKLGIIRELSKRSCDVVVVPYNTSAKEILALQPDGIVFSNGPGNPKDIIEVITTMEELLGKSAILGICLGHLLLSLACGADTKKLPFGHRGSNHPVKRLRDGKIEITSQSHGYVVDENSLENTGLTISHIAVNDQSIEGLTHVSYPMISVQYHPEANPGPQDSNYIFDEFIKLMEKVGGEDNAKTYRLK